VVPVSALQGRSIKTVEGLGTLDKPGRMQRAFIEGRQRNAVSASRG
jgi:nicotinate dehydrogenase subunit A